MSTQAIIEISEAKDSAVVNHVYKVSVTKDGAPLAGAEVSLVLEGAGSIASQFSAKEAKRETDAAGEIQAGWYRRSIWGRDLRAKLTATVEADGAQIAFEEFQPEVSRTSYNIPKKPLRI
jgi:hypothetical protein